MRTVECITLTCLLGIPACGNHRREAGSSPATRPAAARVGVYDSRAVAVAYCDNEHHKEQDGRLNEALKKARQSGDADQIRRADRALWESRKRMHRQAFSTCPVDDILGQYPEEVDRIKRDENLAALVSRWDAKGLSEYKHAETVDVTERLVHMLTADEKRRRNALGITKVKPIPPAEYEELLKKEAGEHY